MEIILSALTHETHMAEASGLRLRKLRSSAPGSLGESERLLWGRYVMNLAIKGNWSTDRVSLDLWHARV